MHLASLCIIFAKMWFFIAFIEKPMIQLLNVIDRMSVVTTGMAKMIASKYTTSLLKAFVSVT